MAEKKVERATAAGFGVALSCGRRVEISDLGALYCAAADAVIEIRAGIDSHGGYIQRS